MKTTTRVYYDYEFRYEGKAPWCRSLHDYTSKRAVRKSMALAGAICPHMLRRIIRVTVTETVEVLK